ncbi:methyltransferase domain-containing protein [Nocardia otitidiscaviarum]|uniref:class I SAM-dependent methyltransferase n=1 Tax=Nocardia otitidiscaviarum TaxID=1823 RepID=UPI0004A7397E|nr:class I SAM-dependent methyltransferase [Nocardia otitidiscaviarum]MBF6131672.1 methyltransferase domain-containing protein [Nocardia otitidiscaviarum]MBF6482804.1 methyltransferase domain-containing protein [Nocardia otitidiscaviarum]
MEIANIEQHRLWNGADGAHWAAHQARYDAMAAPANTALFDTARILPTDRVLDIGCGTGQTTRIAARLAVRGHAMGLDLSAPMLESARRTAVGEGIDNIVFEQGDAQVFPFAAAAFEVAISRAGTMFFEDPVAAFGNIGRALVPGGRITFLCHRELDERENPILPTLIAHLPAADFGEQLSAVTDFADPSVVDAILDRAGFVDRTATPVAYHAPLGRDALDATDFLLRAQLRGFVASAEPTTLCRVRDALITALRPYEIDGAVRVPAGGWVYVGNRRS